MAANGYLALVLHAHLPFIRHPEHEQFLEETWFFEAVIETYLPLLRVFRGWQRDGLPARVTVALSPTLCSMLQDPLLRARCARHLELLSELAAKETVRHTLQPGMQALAEFYTGRLAELRQQWQACGGDLLGEFNRLRQAGVLELVTTSATHAVLPLMAAHPASLRAQVLTARDHFRACFGVDPTGFWLPECAWSRELEPVLREANLRWFVTETHGILGAAPRPRYGPFAPVFTEGGVAAFGRDHDSARQVWSRDAGYPGDPRYRDFYRDAGFDADLEYLRPYLAADHRGFTGLKYHRITGPTAEKELYDRAAALMAVEDHARHFLHARAEQARRLGAAMDRPAMIVAPYDAELFGHWWYEGAEFLDRLVRKICEPGTGHGLELLTPGDYLRRHPVNQVAEPAASSWGEQGYWSVWLNEKNEWVHRQLQTAQGRMTELVEEFEDPNALQNRALCQSARELLLAQASDWPFILRTGTSPEYAAGRVRTHLNCFTSLYEQLLRGRIDEPFLKGLEARDNLFPAIDAGYWKKSGPAVTPGRPNPNQLP